MFHLETILRLGSAALRRLRQPPPRPSCRRPSLELLPDRILPSLDLVIPVRSDYAVELAEPAIEQMRFMEVPPSGDLLKFWESSTFSLSAKEMLDIVGYPSQVEQLGTPVVTRDTVVIDGQAFATLELECGPSITANLVFAGMGAGSAGNVESAPDAKPLLLGGLLELSADGSERRFLMDYRGPGEAGPRTPSLFGLLAAEATGADKATPSGPGGPPAIGVPESAEASPLSATSGPCLALFMAGLASGTQIAGGLSTPSADDAGANAMAEVAVHTPGNPADVLLTVDTVLPDARADLVRLQSADLALVPTYVVGTAPATPPAPPRADDRPDLGLASQVVGLDEVAPNGSNTPASTESLFEQLACANGWRGEPASILDLAGIQPGPLDFAVAVPAEAEAPQSTVPTDAAPALQEQLDGLLQRGEKWRISIPVLALEVLMAFIYWRGLRPDRKGDRPAG